MLLVKERAIELKEKVSEKKDLITESLLRLFENSDKVIDGLTKAGVAYLGYKAAKNWGGALAALVALKLAQSGNIVSGAAGIATLGTIGLGNVDLGAITSGLPEGETYISQLLTYYQVPYAHDAETCSVYGGEWIVDSSYKDGGYCRKPYYE